MKRVGRMVRLSLGKRVGRIVPLSLRGGHLGRKGEGEAEG